jgi:hypothetical protein
MRPLQQEQIRATGLHECFGASATFGLRGADVGVGMDVPGSATEGPLQIVSRERRRQPRAG